VLGACLSGRGLSFKVVSKYAPRSPLRPIQAAEETLALLGLVSLHGYLFHDVADFTSDGGGKWDEFRKLRHSGRADRVGFSLYHPRDAEMLIERGLDFDLVQIPYSLLDRRFERLLPDFKRRGVEVHVRSVFLQGLVFRKPRELPEFFRPVRPSLQRLAMHAAESGLSIESLCLGFALSNKAVDRVVIGVECVSDLEDDLRRAKEAETAGIDWTDLGDIECTDEEMLVPLNWKT
jgi:aryl-alcohol dehydrogenase-like predicted oxidoreductase